MPTGSNSQPSERNFRLLWFAQTSSLVGVQFGVVAIPLVAVVTLNASPFQVGLLTSLSSVAWLAFGLFVGVAVDRLPRKSLIILSHLGRSALLIGVAGFAMLDMLSMAGLYVIVFLVGILSMLFETAYQAFLPTISAPSQLGVRNGKLAVTDGLSRTVGPSSAGYVVQLASGPVALLAQSFGYLLACLATIGIKSDAGAEVVRREPPARALVDSVAFIRVRRVLRTMLASEMVYLFCFNVTFSVVMVFYVREVGLSPAEVGIVFAAGSVGGIASGVLSIKATTLGLRVHLLLGSSLRAAGLALIPLALFLDDGVMFALAGARFLNSFGWTLWEVRKRTEIQLRTPRGMLGRVQGFFLFCSRGSEATGALTGAAFAAALGTVATVTIGCLAGIASTLVLLRTPDEQARDT
jgi:MFS family permease